MPTGPADPENPQDLRGAPMTLSGTVRTSGGCVFLDTPSGRWLLSGQPTTTLRDGATATVRGRPTAVPARCTASRALAVQRVG
jgi:hypothetical protein